MRMDTDQLHKDMINPLNPHGPSDKRGQQVIRELIPKVCALLLSAAVYPCNASPYHSDTTRPGEINYPRFQKTVELDREFSRLGQPLVLNNPHMQDVMSVSETSGSINQSPGLGRSQWQVLSNLGEIFPTLDEAMPVDGQPRRMGSSKNKLATLEIIGDPADVHSVTVMLGLPNDNPQALKKNLIVCFTVIENTLPTWSDGTEWLQAAMLSIADTPEKTSEDILVGNATVTLQAIKDIGILTLSISR